LSLIISPPPLVALSKRGGGSVVNTTAGFLSVVTNVTVDRIDDQVSSGAPGKAVAVGFDQSGTVSGEQDRPGRHFLGGSLEDTPSVNEGSGPPTLPGPLDNVGKEGSVSQKLGVLIVG
jgi:hypothetical protein